MARSKNVPKFETEIEGELKLDKDDIDLLTELFAPLVLGKGGESS